MGWPFDEASWNSVEGAYYSAMGAEGFWVALSAILCIAALVVGSRHELDAYKRLQGRPKS